MLFFILYRDHFAEGLRLYELNRFDEALAAYDMAIKHNPSSSDAYCSRGNCLKQLNRFDEALVAYDMAIKHNPTYSMAHNGIGACLGQLNRLDEALTAYDMAIKHDPNNVTAIDNRKLFLEKLKSKYTRIFLFLFYKLTLFVSI